MVHDGRGNFKKTILPGNNSACFYAIYKSFTKSISYRGHYFIFHGLESITRTLFGTAMDKKIGHWRMGTGSSARIIGDSRVQFQMSIHSKSHPLFEISFLISARKFARNSKFFVQNFFRFDHKFHHKNPV